MTREEAIYELERMKTWSKDLSDNEIEAIVIALKALSSSQEPYTDAISREAVLKTIDTKAWEFCDYLISKGRNDEQKPVSHFADNLRECISEDLPSVTPAEKVGQWIDAEVLDEIRSEIVHLHDWAFSREEILRIIDKYKASPTGVESEG